MYYVFSVLIVIVAVLLVLIVMVQNSKGGGLAANFSSSNQAMGVRKTTDFLEKATWTLAIALLVFSIGASLSIGGGTKTAIDDGAVEENVVNQNIPAKTIDLPSMQNSQQPQATPQPKQKPAE
jgi:preprotein translocase subunit SecG